MHRGQSSRPGAVPGHFYEETATERKSCQPFVYSCGKRGMREARAREREKGGGRTAFRSRQATHAAATPGPAIGALRRESDRWSWAAASRAKSSARDARAWSSGLALDAGRGACEAVRGEGAREVEVGLEDEAWALGWPWAIVALVGGE